MIAVPFADRAVGFEAHVGDHVRRISFLDHVRGLLEPGGEIAGLLTFALTDVARGEDRRRVAGERLIDDDHMRQDLVLHLDETRRVDRTLFGVCRDRRHFVSLDT